MKSKYNFQGSIALLVFSFYLIIIQSCKKLVEVNEPVTNTNAAIVYNSDATAAAVLTGIYTNLSKSSILNGGLTSMSVFAGLSADELKLYSGVTRDAHIAYYKNELTSSNINSGASDFWNTIYPTIFIANSAIEGLTNSNSLTPSVKQQLIGEAKFIRAICYFYLVNLYGDVPLVLGIDYKINSTIIRSPKADVYLQIIADLKEAQSLLNINYLNADVKTTTNERVRPTKWAATALLARTYLYTKDWVKAEEEATSIINNTSLFSLLPLNNVFLKNSKEAILQFQPVLTGYNTQDGRLFVVSAAGPNNDPNPVYLNTNLVYIFESGDKRKDNWINKTIIGIDTFYYSYKYKVSVLNSPVTEYLMILRFGEQYLIRAEARAQQGNILGAAADLNIIRARAGLPDITATTQANLLTAIQRERRVELFTEFGHRWLDLKRTNTVDAIMSIITPQKGGTWQTTDQLYPIPLTELQKNPNLVQNAGY